MKHLARISALLLTVLANGCFNGNLQCSPCGDKGSCPNGLTCQSGSGMCVSNPDDTCQSTKGNGPTAPDAEPDVPVIVGPDMDADQTPDGEADVPVPPLPGSMCIDECWVNGIRLPFPPRLKQGLLLWADRSSLGEPGYPLEQWRDRSVNSTDIVPLNADTPPDVELDPVGPLVRIDTEGMAMAATNGAALQLGIEDFTILVLAQSEPNLDTCCIFGQTTNVRPRHGVLMNCDTPGWPFFPVDGTPTRGFLEVIDDTLIPSISDGSVASQRTDLPGALHLYGARRVDGNRLQIRIDGALEGEREIPSSTNLVDEEPFFVGTCPTSQPYTTDFIGKIAAVVVVRGPLTDGELSDLEQFLLNTLGENAPPF